SNVAGYQWQKTTPPGTTFGDISGATMSSLTINNPIVAMSGTQFMVNMTANSPCINVSRTATLTVNQAPLCLTYDGLTFGVTNTNKCYIENGGKIRIILTVVGTPVGDVSTAVVKVDVGNTTNASTTYVAPANGNPGYFYYDWTVPCPAMTNTANSETFEVVWTIGASNQGNYTGADCNETEALITISAPSLDFTTGGGYIFNNKSKGSIGIAAGETPSKNNYGFNCKWTNNLKNLQGNFNTIIRQGGKQYQVKTNKPTYLTTIALPAYMIGAKTYYPYEAVMVYENAVYKDLTAGTSQGGGPSSVVYLRVVDNGEPNTAGTPRIDQISILYKLNNTVIYSSEAYTVINDPAVIKLMDIVKGNIQVHVAGAKTTTDRSLTINPAELAPTGMALNLIALPNPSSNHFTLKLQTSSSEKMNVRVMDILGRTVQTMFNLSANQTIEIGEAYHSGLYVVELTQGAKKQQLKLVKL
ncbi:MAG: T9SS type A sorting domain-containing protein, partial [Bacteroidota bacterium]|nr:T9SS type A sorting domain-containing protein [Bacteroidota bacterium]